MNLRLAGAIALMMSPTFAFGVEAREAVIVVLRSQPAASYDGGVQRLVSIPDLAGKPGRRDMRSDAALAYVVHLRNEQQAFLDDAAQLLSRDIEPIASMQHATNALILSLTDPELATLREHPDVLLVEQRVDLPLNTDAGPVFIGAHQLWFGQAGASAQALFSNGLESGFGNANRGDGVVVGVIDSGANQDSPSFADPSPDGFDHPNPLGGSARLGWCNSGVGTVTAECNDKLIGAWDFVDTVPASPSCVAGSYFETLGIEDENSHGSHTASTAVGNPRRDVLVPSAGGLTTDISGVAPRSHLVVYDACYTCTIVQNGQQVQTGLCPNTSTLQSVNQAVADNIVDVINYSIGGGNSPWSDSVSLAMLSATNAGILVSASAGNSGPAANTLGHREPWTMTVAASTHDRAFFGAQASVTSPSPPVALQSLPGIFGESSPTTTAAGSLRHNTTVPQGCLVAGSNPYSAGYFQNAIAVIDRGGCAFSEKIANAVAVGAVGVIVANNNPTAPILMGGAGGAVTSIMISQANGTALKDFIASNPTAAGQIAGVPSVRAIDPGFGDVMATFSSRGPASATPNNVFLDSIKPDVSGPGVSILAAASGAANALAFLQGTSMSSPHAAGAAALVRSARPAWTPAEVKSALVMTGRTAMFKENGTTPSDPFDRGGGRIQPFVAAQAGLVMNETQSNFSAANPGSGGNPATLNLPSLANDLCMPNCSFVRNLRSTGSASTTWSASIVGVNGTVAPNNFTVNAGDVQAITVTIDGTALGTTFSFGELVLTPSNGAPVLRMPIAVRR